MRLSPEQVEQIRELRYGDGLSCPEVAARFGVFRTTIQKHAPGRPGKVPVAPVRAIFVASGRTASDVARSLGWWSRESGADTSRVRRTLGLADELHGHRRRTGVRRKMMDAEIAGRIAEACGAERWEVGA